LRIETAAEFEREIWPGTTKPGHEGLRLDFKRQLSSAREAAIDVAAFANGEGGTILYGVEEGLGPDGYKVASGLFAIDVDGTKAQLEAALDVWLPAEQRPEIYPIATAGQGVLVVRIRASTRLVAVRAESHKAEGLVFVGRNNHGKYYMGADEVERRIQGYAARAMRLRVQEFLDHGGGGHVPGEPIALRVYYGRRQKEPAGQPQNLVPHEWEGGCTLVAASEWSAALRLKLRDGLSKEYAAEIPYELVTLAWWQPTPGVPHPGRPAILVDAYLAKPSERAEVVEVTPLLGR